MEKHRKGELVKRAESLKLKAESRGQRIAGRRQRTEDRTRNVELGPVVVLLITELCRGYRCGLRLLRAGSGAGSRRGHRGLRPGGNGEEWKDIKMNTRLPAIALDTLSSIWALLLFSGIILSSAILLGFADSTKMAGK
jgi:hypothetical protein